MQIRKNNNIYLFKWLLFTGCCLLGSAEIFGDSQPNIVQVIEANNTQNQELDVINNNIASLREQMSNLQRKIQFLLWEKTDRDDVVAEINLLRKKLSEARLVLTQLKEDWVKKMQALSDSKNSKIGMIVPRNFNVVDFIAEFGDGYALVVPKELAGINFILPEHIFFPETDRSAVLTSILHAVGLGIKNIGEVSCLYKISDVPSEVMTIVDSEEAIYDVEDGVRIGWIFTPTNISSKVVATVLKDVYGSGLSITSLGHKLLIFGYKQDLLVVSRIFKSFMHSDNEGKIIKKISLANIFAQDAQQLVKLSLSRDTPLSMGKKQVFVDSSIEVHTAVFDVFPKTLFLCGAQEDVDKVAVMLQDADNALRGTEEKIIYVHLCKNVKKLASLDTAIKALFAQFDRGVFFVSTDSQGVHYSNSDDIFSQEPNSARVLNGETVADGIGGKLIILMDKKHLSAVRELLDKIDSHEPVVEIEVTFFEKRGDKNTFARGSRSFIMDLASIFKGFPFFNLGGIVSKLENAAYNVLQSLLLGTVKMKFGGEDASGSLINNIAYNPANGYQENMDLNYRWLSANRDIEIYWNIILNTSHGKPGVFSSFEEGEFYINNTSVVNEGGEIDTPKSTGSNDRTNSGSDDSGHGVKKALSNRVVRAKKSGFLLQATPYVIFVDGEVFVQIELDIQFDANADSKNRDSLVKRHIKNVVQIKDGQFFIIGGLQNIYKESVRDGNRPKNFISRLFGDNSSDSYSESVDDLYIAVRPKVTFLDSSPDDNTTDWRPGDYDEFLLYVDVATKLDRTRPC